LPPIHAAYGRYLLPKPPAEKALDSNPAITTTQRRIFFPANAPYTSTEVEYSEEVQIVPEELSPERRRSGRWVFYKTWEMLPKEGEKPRKAAGVDVILTHGR
jgi:hypothetical protein